MESEINDRVHRLYDLASEEIQLVEQAARKETVLEAPQPRRDEIFVG